MNYYINLTDQEVTFIGAALNEFPQKFIAPLIQKIQTQINEQNDAAAQAEAAKNKALSDAAAKAAADAGIPSEQC